RRGHEPSARSAAASTAPSARLRPGSPAGTEDWSSASGLLLSDHVSIFRCRSNRVKSNRLTQNTTSYTYDRADRILTAGSVSYTVNANGNVTARGSDTFSYDQANRLTSATVSGTTTTYSYDGDGKRATQTVASSTTSYVYDPNKALP